MTQLKILHWEKLKVLFTTIVLLNLHSELSEKAKADLKEFEEQEEKKRQNRYGRGRGGRGGRGRGCLPGYGMHDFRGNRRRINDQRYPLMGNMNMQVNIHLKTEYVFFIIL